MDLAQAIVDAITAPWEHSDETPRSYIGASTIGNQCDAFLAFSLRGFPGEFTGRQRRIFWLGKLIEAQTIGDLKRAGLKLWELDAVTGRQFRWEDWGGHVACHADGLIELDESIEPFLLEIKSMNDSEWQKTKKHGLKKAHGEYYDQVQMLMGMGGFSRSVFVFYNKDNSAYNAEVVEFDEFVFAHQRVRIERVLDGEAKRIGRNASFWKCKLCSRNAVCWTGAPAPKTCAGCANSHPVHDGTWFCRLHGKTCDQPCYDWKRWEPQNA